MRFFKKRSQNVFQQSTEVSNIERVRNLLRNGPGSPGETTKTIANEYELLEMSGGDWNEIFQKIYLKRMNIFVSNGLAIQCGSVYRSDIAEDVVNFTSGDLALFVFILMYIETRQFRDSVLLDEQALALTIEVIHEVTFNKLPKLSFFEMTQLSDKIEEFMESDLIFPKSKYL